MKGQRSLQRAKYLQERKAREWLLASVTRKNQRKARLAAKETEKKRRREKKPIKKKHGIGQKKSPSKIGRRTEARGRANGEGRTKTHSKKNTRKIIQK
jgi:hypothetical protein